MTEARAAVVSATFTVTFDWRVFHGEAELAAGGPELLARIRSVANLEGSIDIAAPGSPPTRIADELAPWIQNLCFRAIPALGMGEPTRIQYFSRSGFLLLTPQGEDVELTSDKTPTALYPRKPLMRELVACGERFLAFAGGLKRDDQDYMANLNYVTKFLEPARAALLHM